MDRLKAEGFLAVASATNIEQVERILKENGVASRPERMISASNRSSAASRIRRFTSIRRSRWACSRRSAL